MVVIDNAPNPCQYLKTIKNYNSPDKQLPGFNVSIVFAPGRLVRTITSLLSLFLVTGSLAVAQEAVIPGNPGHALIVEYPAAFFQKYQPETALEIVTQVPGFQLNDGSSSRGFGAVAGNVLIDGRRPTIKTDTLSATLGRIPASLVERVDLIRGQVRGIELLGQSSVANVILRDDLPASVYWDIFFRYNFTIQPVTTIPTISLTDRWKGIEYNAGLFFRTYSNGDPGTEQVYDADNNLTENRVEPQKDIGDEYRANLNFSTWLGETLFGFNSNIDYVDEEQRRPSIRYPYPTGPVTDIFIANDFWTLDTEIGADAERLLGENLFGKAILLYNRSETDSAKTQRFATGAVQTQLRLEDTVRVKSESIARLEFSWSGLPGHAIQTNIEGALNSLDGTLARTEDRGMGLQVVDVPGSNTRVEELRGNFLAKDTWTLGKFELAYGLGIERSRISQTGDAEKKRHFTYYKPQSSLTYSPVRARQTRVSLSRTISQLNFGDFVSASNFEDDVLALGNPDLRSETTWESELSQEWRIGPDGVYKLIAFHHWISDVEDLVPLTSDFEVPGNIGKGRRWGVILESTTPLGFLGLQSAKLKLNLRWQDSSVTDQVTGEKRVLSDAGAFGTAPSFRNENSWAVDTSYRQDFEAQRVAWGWSVRSRAERPVFRVNELNIYDDGTEINVFMETTRWFGIKIKVEGINITNHIETRDRIMHTGERGSSGVDYREFTDAYNGARFILTMSGSY